MKTIILFITVAFTIILAGCSGKEPFKAENAKESLGLVYVYIAEDSFIDDSTKVVSYDVSVNQQMTEDSVKVGEYLKFDIKPGEVIFSLVQEGLEIGTIRENIEAEKIYYLRGQRVSNELGGFEFKKVDGNQDIKNYVYASKYISQYNLSDALVTKDNPHTKNVKVNTKESSSSKLDDIKKAYEMKEQGLLTNDEFKKMKAEILAK